MLIYIYLKLTLSEKNKKNIFNLILQNISRRDILLLYIENNFDFPGMYLMLPRLGMDRKREYGIIY